MTWKSQSRDRQGSVCTRLLKIFFLGVLILGFDCVPTSDFLVDVVVKDVKVEGQVPFWDTLTSGDTFYIRLGMRGILENTSNRDIKPNWTVTGDFCYNFGLAERNIQDDTTYNLPESGFRESRDESYRNSFDFLLGIGEKTKWGLYYEVVRNASKKNEGPLYKEFRLKNFSVVKQQRLDDSF